MDFVYLRGRMKLLVGIVVIVSDPSAKKSARKSKLCNLKLLVKRMSSMIVSRLCMYCIINDVCDCTSMRLYSFNNFILLHWEKYAYFFSGAHLVRISKLIVLKRLETWRSLKWVVSWEVFSGSVQVRIKYAKKTVLSYKDSCQFEK